MAKTPQIFETTFNTYSATGLIGEGGAGRVFAVKDIDGQEFALKCLFPATVNTERRKRFKHEIAFCSKMQHRNIISVLDSGFSVWDKQKCPFYVMPRYPFTLRKLVGKMAPDEILPLFSQILDGVEAAHLLHVFHRDLKPENILCNKEGKHIVVADFGIAHFEEEMLLTSVETKDTARMANFCYSSPEQRFRGGVVDYRADIFALGLMLNEMFTGAIPQGEGYRTIESVAPQYGYLDPLVEDMIQNNAEKRLSIQEIKEDLIGRRNAFVSQQELDQRRREVVRTSAPPQFDPIKLLAVDDYADYRLSLQLNRQPESSWIQRFIKPREGYNSIGSATPSHFAFHDSKAHIALADENHAQSVVNYFKSYLELANRGYQQDLVDQAQYKDRQLREQLAERQAEAERRARVLRGIDV